MATVCSIFTAAVLLVSAGAASAQHGRIVHIKLQGAVECARQVEEFRGFVAEAKREGAGCIAVELDGKTARPDLALAIALELRGCGVESVALLTSTPGSHVGPGQALIALAADATWMSPRTAIEAAPEALRAHRDLAAQETDWEQTERDLVAGAWKSLERRGADPHLALVLASPAESLWAVQRDGGFVLTSTTPAAGDEAQRLVLAGAGGFERLHIDAVTAMRLKMVAGTAQSMHEAIARSGGPAGDRTTRTIRSGLHAARTSSVSGLRSAAVEIKRITAHLNVKQRHSGRVITESDYRRAGEEALAKIAALDAGLASIEKRFEEYPELLVVQRPPGSRATRPPADSIAGQLASVRKDLEKLRVTASEYATRK